MITPTDIRADVPHATGDALAERADMQAMALAATVDAATLSAVLTGTERGVARKMAGSAEETSARADALCRALQAVTRGVPTDQAIGAAVRNACRDAVERAAVWALQSLDYTSSDGMTLADMIDAGHVGTARLSAYDEQAGIWRGVSRVPHPEDVTRPLEMPAPADLAETARASMTPEALAVLDATVAVNVAVENQRKAALAELVALATSVASDVDALTAGSRSTTAQQASKTLKAVKTACSDARRERRSASAARPRTSEVASVLGRSQSGPARTILARQQQEADRAYWMHRDALVSAALDAWMERLDDAADQQRARLDNRHARAAMTPRLSAMTTDQAIRLAKNGQRARALAALDAASPLADRAPYVDPRTSVGVYGATLADPADREHGTRPRRSLAGWDAWRALPGSTRQKAARDQAVAADVDARSCPVTSRQSADVERVHVSTLVAPSRRVMPRAYVPGPASASPAAAVAAYALSRRDALRIGARVLNRLPFADVEQRAAVRAAVASRPFAWAGVADLGWRAA